jgi:sodium/bile acid cotransporter 7
MALMSRPKLPSWFPIDGYVLILLATVVAATLLPATGTASDVLGHVSTAAIAILFFLYGARLSTADMLQGLVHWRLHLTVLATTFVLFPLLGLAGRALVPHVLAPELYNGFLFLCLVPSTIQSSITFTSIARGNVPAAICAGSFSSIVGIFATPLLAALLISGGSADFSADSLLKIALQLLAPFLAGQLLRRWVAGFLVRRKKVLGYFDRSSILLVVYAAFSLGMSEGIWRQISPARLGILLGVEAVLLAVMLALTWYGTKKLGFERADRVAIQFAGSKKSLAAGLPMASVLFGAHASLAVLPLMLYHQMQLMVCAVIARRRGRDVLPGDAADALPEGAAGEAMPPVADPVPAGKIDK